MAEIVIPYKPREWTRDVHESEGRWKVIVCHRRAGKTVSALNHLQRDALQTPNSRFAYIAPTYRQAKNVAWDLIKFYARPIPDVSFNEAELRVDYPNGARITLYGADNPDALRGIGLWGVVFDEYSQQPSNIFSEIIRPALADHEGYAIWIGTPKGKNDFYHLFEHAKQTENWLAILKTVDDTGEIPESELQDARCTMTEDEYQQEFYCSFEAAIQGAYYSKELARAREEKRITNVPYQENALVHTWWDLGVGDSTSIGFFQQIGTGWAMIDYYEASGEGLSHYVQVLKEKKYIYGEHYAPHDIQVRNLGETAESRLEIAKKLGINFRITPKLSLEDGINAARLRFSTLWIDEDKCGQFVNAISLYRKEWNNKMGEFKSHPLHDWTSHAADMFRYWAVTPMKGSTRRPKKARINRGKGIYGV
jgi:hypothetical protein